MAQNSKRPGRDKVSAKKKKNFTPDQLAKYKRGRRKRIDWLKLPGNNPGVKKKSKKKVKAMSVTEKAKYRKGRTRRKNFMQKHELGYWTPEKSEARVEQQALDSETDLMTDPTYAAFQRQLGESMKGVNSSLLSVQDGFRRERERRAPIFADQLITAKREARSDASARGMFRSGYRIDDEERRKLKVEDTDRKFQAQYGVGGELDMKARATAATQISSLQNKAIEQGLSSASILSAEEAAAKFNQSQV